MRHARTLVTGAVALVLISASAAVAQSPVPEAWTQSDVFKGFDPMVGGPDAASRRVRTASSR